MATVTGRQIAAQIAEQMIDEGLDKLQAQIRLFDASDEAKHLGFSMVMNEVSRKAHARGIKHQKAVDAIVAKRALKEATQ
jgi:hypothetical protein